MRQFALVLIALLCGVTISFGGEVKPPATEIITNDGIAFSWKESDTSAVVAYDIVSAWKHKEALVADCSKFRTSFKGAGWCFANAENLTAFLKKADKDGNNSYLPFLGGRCALGTSWGMIAAAGDPRTAHILQGDFGPILVLQSAQKWWPLFNKDTHVNLVAAKLLFAIEKRNGHIVPNAKK